MKLRKPDLRTANRVFAELSRYRFTAGSYTDLYVNGRERGYTVVVGDYQASFSENRNSDEIVVYLGRFGTFGAAGVPSEAAWSSARYFKPHEVAKAAEAIAYHLSQKD